MLLVQFSAQLPNSRERRWRYLMWEKKQCVCACCWKWPAVPFPRYLLTRRVTQLLVGVWPITCPRAALACLPRILWTGWTIRVIVSHVTREHERCVGRVQLLVDNGYVYGAHYSELGNYTDIVNEEAAVRYKKSGCRTTTDRAPTTTVRALQRPSGLWQTTPGPRTTPTGEDAEAAGSERWLLLRSWWLLFFFMFVPLLC